MALESKLSNMSDPILKIDHVSMKFGGLVAVNDLSFEAKRGEITALIGPNGAGKTTVFNCITGFYKPTEGMMTLKRKNGESYLLERMPDFEVNKVARVARTFQNIRLFSGLTLLENLLVAQHNALMKASGYTVLGLFGFPAYKKASGESVEKARHWLERIGLVDRADQPAGDLPYGAQRRLEIARAMCTEPELLCLDEPAAGLNPRESAELNSLLTAIPKETGTSILLIEHDMSVVMEISDHVVVLEYGTKISDGTPAHVKSDPKVIAAYLGVDDDEVGEVLAAVSGETEAVLDRFDAAPDAAHAPRNSASMFAGSIDTTIGHSNSDGENVKISAGASRANRVGSAPKKAPKAASLVSSTATVAKAPTVKASVSKPITAKSKPASAPVAAKVTATPKSATVKVATATSAGVKPANEKVVAVTSSAPKAATAKVRDVKAPAVSPVAVKVKPVAAKPVAAKPVVAKAVTTKATVTKATVTKTPAPKAAPVAKAEPRLPDDLKRIKGIGPVNDAKLRAHGINTFKQIAAWKKADIIAVEKYLEFDGRIAREDWMAQAKILDKTPVKPAAKTKTGGAK